MQEKQLFNVPNCETCWFYYGRHKTATYDTRTKAHLFNVAYLCDECFDTFGILNDDTAKVTCRPSIFDSEGKCI